jgi:hypothetical protein
MIADPTGSLCALQKSTCAQSESEIEGRGVNPTSNEEGREMGCGDGMGAEEERKEGE